MVRRVVTANNKQGKSYFAADDIVDDRYAWWTFGDHRLGHSPDDAPATLLPTTAPDIEPAPGGSKCTFFTIQPWKIRQEEIARGAFPGLDPSGFHRTATLDYIMVTEGEVTLMLDIGETVVRAGDMVVQRNTNHSWRVLGDMPVKLWGVMVSLV
jgi:quercetin dioxygenase-like cupin family protein